MSQDVVLGTLRLAVIVEFDDEGVPRAVRWPCRNPRCCPPEENKVSVHRVEFTGLPDLVGSIEQRYEARKRSVDLTGGSTPGKTP